MSIKKTSNAYAEAVSGKLYADTPKAVFAAIAVSALTGGGDYLEEAAERLLTEWQVLYENGIVPQRPPGARS